MPYYIDTSSWTKEDSHAVAISLVGLRQVEDSVNLWPVANVQQLSRALQLKAITQFDFDRIRQQQRYWEREYDAGRGIIKNYNAGD